MTIVTRRDECAPFTTKDGSTIRELMAYRNSACESMSLAEASLLPGCKTECHLHPTVEEIYYFLEGKGRILAGDDYIDVEPGCLSCIVPACGTRPGTPATRRSCSSVNAPRPMNTRTPSSFPMPAGRRRSSHA
ncbi:MAG: hypothetical protein LUE17_10635 [Planctomycetaceae bacterium]|nr:hypothetical protein [Planctomycetaceae bacterium]